MRDPGLLMLESEFMRRIPSWRWNLILELQAENAKPTRAEDKLIARAFRYFTQYAKLNSSVDQAGEGPVTGDVRRRFRRLAANYPNIALAHQIYVMGVTERFALEALVCAGATSEYIAENLPAAPELVDTYERLFFDVRPRLKAKIFMIDQVLRTALVKGNFNTQYDFVWKSIAYYLGVDSLMAYIGGGQIDKSILDQWHETIQGELAKDTLLAAKCRVVNQYNCDEVINQYIAMRGQETANAGVQLGAQATSGVNIMLQAMTFASASVRGRALHPIEERPFQQLNLLAGRGFFAKEALTA